MTVEPAYMRIRDYIVSHFYKADETPDKIHSEHELCRLFKVSRVTARAALKGLVDEGYLVSHCGMGTFTNPEKLRQLIDLIERKAKGRVRQTVNATLKTYERGKDKTP